MLKIIHGYPPLYNAGSENYSRTLCHSLVDAGNDVAVFTRFEDPFVSDYTLTTSTDPIKPEITLFKINMARDRDRFSHKGVDEKLDQIIRNFQPEIVHIGHINHLSTSMIKTIAEHNIPIVFTLHDFWLMCPRGQFLQTGLGSDDLWMLCDGQENEKCAKRCYSRYFSGLDTRLDEDIKYWISWIRNRMDHVKHMVNYVNLFIAPSRHIYTRFMDEFGIPEKKLVYLDYGFNKQYLVNRKRKNEDYFVFGYIGTHIPAKGIQHLIQAFGCLRGKSKLRIFGRSRPQNTEGLQKIVETLPEEKQREIEWYPEYQNENIVTDVFNIVDAIVVPSIWDENSPLVIHEAQQVRVPVITADFGGMCEYVSHEVNGLLFEHRNVESLRKQMQRFIENPRWASSLGVRGYLYSESGDIPSIESHVKSIIKLYKELLERDNKK